MPEFPPDGVPRITPLPSDAPRPFWSVMIPVYNRVTYLEQAIRSVTGQFQADEAVQIEVVDDCSPEKPEIAQILARVGDSRVSLHRNETRLGMVGNWNRCIERSCGQWVHLLHDDDYVLPGFYAAHRAAAEGNPTIGFAATGAGVLEGAVITPWHTLFTQTGITPDWLRWLVYSNVLLMPSVVVRRAAFETVGGFHPGIEHAVDWEMWMRLASRFPLWFDPAMRAVYRKHESSETQRQVRTGANVVDILRALEVARTYIPGPQADSKVRMSRETWAVGVMNTVRGMLRSGEVVAAMNQFREAMNLAVSPKIIREIESGTMRWFDEYYKAVEAAVMKLRERSADDNLVAQLREERRRLCRQWIELPADMLQVHFDSDLGRVHKLLMGSDLAKTPIDAFDKELLDSLANLGTTTDHAGLIRSLYMVNAHAGT